MRGTPPANTVDEWLARLSDAQRAALEKLRTQIKGVVPGADEVISYGQPTFKLNGHLVAFGAFKNHLSFFPMNSVVIGEHAAELKGYQTSKGTIQFTLEKPIPAAVVKKIVKARAAQNLRTADERARKKAASRTRPKATARPKSKTKPDGVN